MLLRKIREKEKRVCVTNRGSLFVWLFDICGLQFEIAREVCYRLVLVLRFGDLLSWCVATFGFALWLSLWFVHNSHLIFGIRIWYLWTFGSLVCICERELFGCIWDLGLWEWLYTNLYYPKFAVVKFVRRRPWM